MVKAVIVNGAAGHALDFDDMGLGGTHPSAAILPAVFALAEKHHFGGARFAEAALTGYQALAWISYACGWSGYRRGFHSTGTVGTFGAALGCAKLLGLDREGCITALGLAATQAAGLKVSFGTLAKHLNAGKAAANGLLAAELSAAGFSAAPDALEGSQGCVETHSAIDDYRQQHVTGKHLPLRPDRYRPECGSDLHARHDQDSCRIAGSALGDRYRQRGRRVLRRERHRGHLRAARRLRNADIAHSSGRPHQDADSTGARCCDEKTPAL